jgi:hypothetical protein
VALTEFGCGSIFPYRSGRYEPLDLAVPVLNGKANHINYGTN